MVCRAGGYNRFISPSLHSCLPSLGPAWALSPHGTAAASISARAQHPPTAGSAVPQALQQHRQREPLASQPHSGLACDLEPRQQSQAQGCTALPIGAGSPGFSPTPQQPAAGQHLAGKTVGCSVAWGQPCPPTTSCLGREGQSTGCPSLSSIIFQTNPNWVLSP